MSSRRTLQSFVNSPVISDWADDDPIDSFKEPGQSQAGGSSVALQQLVEEPENSQARDQPGQTEKRCWTVVGARKIKQNLAQHSPSSTSRTSSQQRTSDPSVGFPTKASPSVLAGSVWKREIQSQPNTSQKTPLQRLGKTQKISSTPTPKIRSQRPLTHSTTSSSVVRNQGRLKVEIPLPQVIHPSTPAIGVEDHPLAQQHNPLPSSSPPSTPIIGAEDPNQTEEELSSPFEDSTRVSPTGQASSSTTAQGMSFTTHLSQKIELDQGPPVTLPEDDSIEPVKGPGFFAKLGAALNGSKPPQVGRTTVSAPPLPSQAKAELYWGTPGLVDTDLLVGSCEAGRPQYRDFKQITGVDQPHTVDYEKCASTVFGWGPAPATFRRNMTLPGFMAFELTTAKWNEGVKGVTCCNIHQHDPRRTFWENDCGPARYVNIANDGFKVVNFSTQWTFLPKEYVLVPDVDDRVILVVAQSVVDDLFKKVYTTTTHLASGTTSVTFLGHFLKWNSNNVALHQFSDSFDQAYDLYRVLVEAPGTKALGSSSLGIDIASIDGLDMSKPISLAIAQEAASQVFSDFSPGGHTPGESMASFTWVLIILSSVFSGIATGSLDTASSTWGHSSRLLRGLDLVHRWTWTSEKDFHMIRERYPTLTDEQIWVSRYCRHTKPWQAYVVYCLMCIFTGFVSVFVLGIHAIQIVKNIQILARWIGIGVVKPAWLTEEESVRDKLIEFVRYTGCNNIWAGKSRIAPTLFKQFAEIISENEITVQLSWNPWAKPVLIECVIPKDAHLQLKYKKSADGTTYVQWVDIGVPLGDRIRIGGTKPSSPTLALPAALPEVTEVTSVDNQLDINMSRINRRSRASGAPKRTNKDNYSSGEGSEDEDDVEAASFSSGDDPDDDGDFMGIGDGFADSDKHQRARAARSKTTQPKPKKPSLRNQAAISAPLDRVAYQPQRVAELAVKVLRPVEAVPAAKADKAIRSGKPKKVPVEVPKKTPVVAQVASTEKKKVHQQTSAKKSQAKPKIVVAAPVAVEPAVKPQGFTSSLIAGVASAGSVVAFGALAGAGAAIGDKLVNAGVNQLSKKRKVQPRPVTCKVEEVKNQSDRSAFAVNENIYRGSVKLVARWNRADGSVVQATGSGYVSNNNIYTAAHCIFDVTIAPFVPNEETNLCSSLQISQLNKKGEWVCYDLPVSKLTDASVFYDTDANVDLVIIPKHGLPLATGVRHTRTVNAGDALVSRFTRDDSNYLGIGQVTRVNSVFKGITTFHAAVDTSDGDSGSPVFAVLQGVGPSGSSPVEFVGVLKGRTKALSGGAFYTGIPERFLA